MKKTIPIALFILLAIASASAQSKERFSARIKVAVTADEPLKSEISSTINREFRRLGDIILTDAKYDYLVSVIAFNNTSTRGEKIGVSFAVLILKPVDSWYIKYLIGQRFKGEILTPDDARANNTLAGKIDGELSDAVKYVGHWLRTGAPEEVYKICHEIVTNFDSDTLEQDRKDWQEIADILESAKKDAKPKP